MSKGEELVGQHPQPEQELSKAELERRKILMQKQAEAELNEYRKRLTKSVEMKRLQVEEIELNIAYFKATREWRDLQPEVEALEDEERAELEQRAKEQAEAKEQARKEAEKQATDEKPAQKQEKNK